MDALTLAARLTILAFLAGASAAQGVRLNDPLADDVVWFTVLPGGERLAYGTQGTVDSLHTVRADGRSPAVPISTPSDVLQWLTPRASSDGRWLVFHGYECKGC